MTRRHFRLFVIWPALIGFASALAYLALTGGVQ